jgi:hypothetical protein
VDLNVRLPQRILDVFANLVAHPRHNPVTHLNNQDARFAM